jgi:drug/metabolite transporter (DMT)-like permease
MFYIIASCLLYTAAIILGAYASRNANTNLVSAIVNIIASVVPVAVIIGGFSEKWKTSSTKGLMAAAVGGALIALFTMALNKAYSQENVAIISPIVFGGAIALSTALSYVIFKEKIVPLQAIGLLFVLVGLGLVIVARLRTT